MKPEHIYTPSEAVQVKMGNRWRNGTIKELRQRGSFIEAIVEYLEKGKPARLLMDTASPHLRKHGENVLAKERKKPMPAYKGKRKPTLRRGRKR